MTSFCRLPWQGIDITPQGEYKPCCKYQRAVARTLPDYLASDELSQLKSEFMSGGRPAACARCWHDEDAGIKSKRQIEFDNYLAATKFDNTIRIISFPFGNICNLACRYCTSYASSKWLDTAAQVQSTLPSVAIWPHQRYYKDAALVDQIKLLSANAVLIEFPGGEPFVTGVTEHKEYLRSLLQHNPQSKSLHYTTNVTIFPDSEFWEIWAQFKNVDIQLSLDGIGDQFEYMRWPGNWDTVSGNIDKYQTYSAARSNIQLSVSHTVGILNVYYVGEFVDWCSAKGLPAPYIGMVLRPYHYNIQTLPADVKLAVTKKLSADEFDPIVSYMMSTPPDIKTDDLFTWISVLDTSRKQSYCTTFSEFAKILSL